MSAREDPRGRPDVARSAAAALGAALGLPVMAALALVMKGIASTPRFSAGATFAILAACLLAGFLAITRRRLPRAGVLAACHAAAWAPLLAIVAWQALAEPLVHGELPWPGGGYGGLGVLAAPPVALGLFLGGIGLGLGLARRGTNRFIRITALAAVSVALLASLFSLGRPGRADGDTYLDTLVVAGEIQTTDVVFAGRALRRDVRRTDYGAEGSPPRSPPEGNLDVDEPSDEEMPSLPRTECRLWGLAAPLTFDEGYETVTDCPPLRVRLDPRGDLGVIETLAPPGNAPSEWVPYVAFHPADGTTTGISSLTLADRVAAPIGWTVGAALGGVLGAVLLFAAHRVRRRGGRLEGIDARHLGAGLVELTTGETLRVDAAAALPLGAVVLGEGAEHAATYRASGGPSFGVAQAGTLEELRAGRADLVAGFEMIGFATAVLGATPLVLTLVIGAL